MNNVVYAVETNYENGITSVNAIYKNEKDAIPFKEMLEENKKEGEKLTGFKIKNITITEWAVL